MLDQELPLLNLPDSMRPAKRRARHSRVQRPSTVLGNWELVRKIGSGSSAEVFAARPIQSSHAATDYAVKRLRSCHHADPIAIRMFRNEIACGQGATHPGLLPIFSAELDSNPHFHVSPLIQGWTLRDALDACGAFTIPHAFWMARQIAEALGALHESGWYHSDVKPANVVGQTNGHATLVDYGFAVRRGEPYAKSFCTMQTTLAYTAPEMFTSNHAAGPASDIYSLGVMLFEMISGELPFPQRRPERLAEAHLHSPAPSARTFVANLPRDASNLITAMLAKDPCRRPSAGSELPPLLAQLEAETFALRA